MVTLADNDVFLKIDGVEVQAFFKEVSPEFSNQSQNTTAGAGQDWVERAPGLNDAKLTISLMYDATNVQSYIQHIKAGQVVEIEYGPEGANSGKPRHVQSFNITSVKHAVTVDKAAVAFDITAEGAATPSVDMNAGGVYS